MPGTRVVTAVCLLVLAALLAGCEDGDATTATAVITTTAAPTSTTDDLPTTGAATITSTTRASTTAPLVLAQELAWVRVPDEEGVLGGPGLEMATSMVAGGPGLVAVGADEAEGSPNAAVWISADGYSWTRVPDNEGALGGPGIQLINAVAVGGPGLVAVGQDDPEGSPATGWVDSDAAVWVSADGYSWTRVPHDEAIFGGPGGQEMVSVTAGGPGLVGIGGDGSDAAVWVSADGYTWTRIDDEAALGGPGNQSGTAVAVWQEGLVLVGKDESGDGGGVVFWVSAHGHTWARIPSEQSAFGAAEDVEIGSVVGWGAGLVMFGGDVSSSDWDAAVWVSPPPGG